MKKNAKKSGFSFNVIDAFIILMVMVVIAAGAFVYIKVSSRNIITETKSVEGTLTADIMKSQFKDLVSEGDKLYDNTTNTELGVITSVTYSPASVNVTVTDGSDAKSGETDKYIYPESEYCKATFTFRCDTADFASGKCKIGEVYIGVGETVVMRTKNYIGTTKCSGFASVESETAAVSEEAE